MKRNILFFFLLTIGMVSGLGQNHSHIVTREKRELLYRAKRRWVLSTIEIEEESPGPYPRKATTLYNDRKVHDNHYFRILGEGVDKDPKGVFSINRKTGDVTVHRSIDREKHPFFHIRFDIMDSETHQAVDRTLSFDVAIKDINDNYPRFEPPNLKVAVKENLGEGGLPVNLQAFDSDEENNDNSRVTMTIVKQEPAFPPFSLAEVKTTKMQQLMFTGCFDYDKVKTYAVIIEGKDHGKPSLSTTTTVTLDIKDANNHQPVFTETTYSTSVPEMVTKEILRMKVSDKDEPNTPASRPVFKILKGNEEGNYMITTDPKTNEGVLSVIKGKDFERTEKIQLEVAVENEEPLFVCKDWVRAEPKNVPPPQTVTVDVEVVDVNDPPLFEKSTQRVFEKEEVPPGRVLFTPKVTDEDSDDDKIRYELIDDVAGWLSIDEKTGAVKSVKTMDRESPHVHNSIYQVKVLAIDDGNPPATGTGTLQIVLGDINDNLPHLVIKSVVFCSHKTMVQVAANDEDLPPYSGPFSFSFWGEEVADVKNKWKLQPSTGINTSLVILKKLAFGNYTIPVQIQDQQGKQVQENLHVLLCDCGGGDDCLGPEPVSIQLGGPAIGALLAGLLLLLLALLLFCLCECEGKSFKHIPLNLDEGHQTLIKYNEEGGGTACKAEPTLNRTATTTYVTTVTDGLKQAAIPLPQVSSTSFQMESQEATKTMRSQVQSMQQQQQQQQPQYHTQYSSGGFQQGMVANNSMRSAGQSMYQTLSSRRSSTMRNGFSRSLSLTSDRYIADHIDRRVYEIGEEVLDCPGYTLCEYAYEGNGSRCQSLDDLSLGNWEENMDFLQDLGPNFKALAGICHRHIEEKSSKP